MLPFLLLLTPAVAPAPATVSFEREVAPLLKTHCLKCHAGKRLRGDLALTSREAILTGGTHGPAIVPGKASASLLFTHVRDGKMPPRNPLSEKEATILRLWIDKGAVWEGGELRPVAVADGGRAGKDWWSLQPIRRPEVPTVKNASLARTSIDRFLLAKLEERGLSFSPEADRQILIRRVTFDLIGLAPTPEDVQAFVSDKRPDAYERLVDRLLASPHYGERWARHWLDVVRFAESHGYEMNTLRPNAWPYRDWAIRAFNRDLSYPQFVREQFVGDLLNKNDPLTQAATGFLVAGAHDMVGNATLEGKLQQRADDLFDMVATTGATFLGLTVGCARCHDHKFDPILQKDFYSLQALLAGVQHADRTISASTTEVNSRRLVQIQAEIERLNQQLDDVEPVVGTGKRSGVSPLRNVERFQPVRGKYLRFVVEATTDGIEPCIDEIEVFGADASVNFASATRGVKATASSVYPNSAIHRIEHINDEKHGNSRSWISNERGKGWIKLAFPEPVTLERIIWARDKQGRFRDRLARDYRIEISDDDRQWKTIASSADRESPGKSAASEAVKKLRDQRTKLEQERKTLATPKMIYAGTFSTPDVVHRLKRGDVMQRLEIVTPDGVEAIRPAMDLSEKSSEPARRKALADWLAHPENPLPARVMVNRLWHWHFGQGIVKTPSDFGFNGDRPSHPELLDWLAKEFLSTGGQIKSLHRMIVLSTAYRQSSQRDSRAVGIDAGNRLLWRQNPRRLEAEAIRDSMLQVTGELDTSMGGPGYNLWDYSGYVIVFKPKEKLGPAEFRRMVYQFKPRLQQDVTFGAFDCPDATATAPRRNVSTTALQALNLLNDPFVLDRAERFADRVNKEVGSVPTTQIQRAFRLAFGRDPNLLESQASLALVQKHGLSALCRALLNANEFIFVH